MSGIGSGGGGGCRAPGLIPSALDGVCVGGGGEEGGRCWVRYKVRTAGDRSRADM